MALTALDLEMPETAAELLAEYGGDYVFRKVLGAFDRQAQRSTSFSSTAISADAADNSINWSAPNDFTAQGVQADSYIYLGGWTYSTTNDGWARVTSVTPTKAVLDKDLTSEAAGNRIGISLAIDYPVKAYITRWEQKWWNGNTILPTDLLVIMAPNVIIPTAKAFLFYEGEDPATAKSYTVEHVEKIQSGQLPALLFLGVRG